VGTIRDVARVAGVSISTVSHVMNGTRFVEPSTRERVVAAIAETGYRQDALARALRRARTDTIGLVVPDVAEPAFAGMIHGIEEGAATLTLSLLLASSAENAERERRAVTALLNRRVDGLILARVVGSFDDLIVELGAERSPTVLLDRIDPALPFDQVGVDNRDAMRRLVAHLLDRGHRGIALIAGDLRVPTLAERQAGFIDAMAHVPGSNPVMVAGRSLDDVVGSLRESGVTAVIASSTPLANLGLDAMTTLGLRTPHDLAFATFDGFNQHPIFTPNITTIRQPAFEIGMAAVALLRERIADGTREIRIERLEATIDFGDSTEGYTS
jgi:LacI family transcriptional regulator